MDLIELKNIGRTFVQWLNSVGIKNSNQLREYGTVEAYLKIKDRGFKVSKVLLYALEGALTDSHWNDVSAARKKELLLSVGEK